MLTPSPQSKSLEKIVCDYLQYADVESLRGSCQYLHNFTKELRLAYKIFPVPRRSVCNRVLHYFLNYSRHGIDAVNNLHNLELIDAMHRPMCPFFMKMACKLSAHQCNLSHNTVCYDRTDLQLSQAYVILEDVETFINGIYGPHFFYKYEAYVRELFLCYSAEAMVNIKQDPMTRKNEVVRTNIPQPTSVLYFNGFQEVMLAVEEHCSGCKDITLHKLFSGAGRQRHLPKVPTDLASLKEPTAYVDPLQQYERPIDVPSHKHYKVSLLLFLIQHCLTDLQGVRVTTKAGFAANEQIRGEADHRYVTDQALSIKEHVEQVSIHAMRAKNLIDKMFK